MVPMSRTPCFFDLKGSEGANGIAKAFSEELIICCPTIGLLRTIMIVILRC